MPKGIQETLLQASTALKNITDNADLKALLAGYGYDDAKVAAAGALLTTVSELHTKQVKEYGEKYAASQAFRHQAEAARATYMEQVKIARIALKKVPALGAEIEIAGRRETSFAAISAQADMFYANSIGNAGILAEFAKFGLTEAKLTAGQTAYTEAKVAHTKQQQEQGEAIRSTRVRDEALAELTEWMGDFITIARLALKDQPEMMVALGV